MKAKALLVFLMVLLTKLLYGQVTAPPDVKTITVDLDKHTFSGPLPYDKPINFVGTLAAGSRITKLSLYLSPGNFVTGQSLTSSVKVSDWNQAGNSTYFTLMLAEVPTTNRYMEADHYYALEIIGYDTGGAVLTDFKYIVNTTSSFGDQVKMDFGALYAPKPKMFSGQIAAHFYAVPVNDEADPVHYKGLAQNIFKRTSLYFGLSVVKLSSDTRQDVKNFVGVGNLVYGVSVHSPFYGYYGRNQTLRRLLQPMYINFGEILFKQADANPLIIKDRNKHAFYMGISYDFNFTSLISPLTKLFTP